ncbi:MAG: 1,4-dihydroxy-2-naphthoate octaprenyltransferase [Caldanaerobacter subterraneus]|jgi:1,4-dihydroxy-2-naphthoate octaprenyltransferase|uniref:prenyltransferase n=1 Tax=unclassified Thermoanaerobacter TaxID=2636821 RepID=UPI0000E1D9A5|nr:prenyltransferase [Thermoanaerobacter sp. X514]KUJ90816.1 MAG: 1,4-dihydroxy-2-naphthoate octaprenyltransferase [Thermoanaerobacter thermocopriae]KUK35119.1 MAG: 1,4-dihydroxy-2-naphthoate octaprenyltransferase [Caldanaerobacter subterraneus]MBZ4656245.1 1,4-dihydroxy-2-naphthoate octaprenyltransferase [Thermoanaerobacter sp.]ABY91981.1 1,4-dihydroxy-2-naphthoate octaprenyltransferase [Thermoanaerobacter sp. X514]MDI3500812.1 1,4-dihydroxy-2-naphthoate polyprenyltransferase [Thermoanaerobac
MNKSEFSRVWKGFWQLADPKIWIASTVPMFVAAAYAYGKTGKFDFLWFFISVIGIYFIEIGKNAVNEVIDYKSGVDTFVTPDKRTPFSGGKKTIVEGKLTVKETIIIAVLTMLAACFIGLIIVVFREPLVLIIGLLGILISIFYSLPPFKFSYIGFGEIAVGVTFGPLIMTGMYLVLTHHISGDILLLSLPIGFLITNVLWINQYPDYEADLRGHKYNLLVRIGKEKGVIVYAALYGAAYLSFIVIAIVTKNFLWLLSFVTLPLAVQSVKIARKYYDNIPKLIKANANTVKIYQITGISMIIASLLLRVKL